METFKSTETLSSIHRLLKEKECLSEGSYTLMTTFPRRVFTSEDTNKTLSELGITIHNIIRTHLTI